MCYCFQVRLHRFALSRNLRLHGRSVDSAEWPMAFPPATVNAFYMYSRNQVSTQHCSATVIYGKFFSKFCQA